MRVASILLLVALPSSSLAVPPPDPEVPEKKQLDLRLQGQIIALAGLPPVEGGFGGVEFQLNVAVYGVGVAMGLLYEHLELEDSGTLFHGGAVHLGLQWRMAASFSEVVHRYVDPHLDLGFLLGGGSSEVEGSFRGSVFVGAGLDLPLRFDNPQLVASVQYRFHTVQSPEDAPAHLLLVGLGIRAVSR